MAVEGQQATPKRFEILIKDLSNAEVMHHATVVVQDAAELATYLRKTATLVDRHGD